MRVFSYDGTFSGLLCVVFDAYTRAEFPDALLRPGQPRPLQALAPHCVVTREDKAARVMAGLARRLSKKALSNVLHAWMSEEPGCDTLIYKAMRRGFDARGSVETDFAHPAVFGVYLLARKVRGEQHKMEGFVRFQKTAQDIYFAVIAPRHNVLPLLLPHFADRFSSQQWAIYDYGRSFGVLCGRHGFQEVSLAPGVLSNGKIAEAHLAEDELFIQELWKRYFKALAVKERINPGLQARCMPRRYWKYLIEKQA